MGSAGVHGDYGVRRSYGFLWVLVGSSGEIWVGNALTSQPPPHGPHQNPLEPIIPTDPTTPPTLTHLLYKVGDISPLLAPLHKGGDHIFEPHLLGYRGYALGPHLVALALVGKEDDPTPLEWP